eukprot:g32483.t1
MSQEADRADARDCRNIVHAAQNGRLGAVRHFLREKGKAALSEKNRSASEIEGRGVEEENANLLCVRV